MSLCPGWLIGTVVHGCTVGRELDARGLACGMEDSSIAKSMKVRGLRLDLLLILFPAL